MIIAVTTIFLTLLLILLFRHFSYNFSMRIGWLFLLFTIPIIILIVATIVKTYTLMAGLSTSFVAMIAQACQDIIVNCSQNLLKFGDPVDGAAKIGIILVAFSFLAALGMSIGRYLSTRRFINMVSGKKIKTNFKIKNLFTELIAQLELKNVPLYIIDFPKPLAFNVGVINPAVYISSNLIGILEIAEIKAVLLHELVHIKRKDNVKQWVGMLLKEATWFLPTSTYCWKHFLKEREETADLRVVEITGQPLEMASALIKYVKNFQHKPLWVATGLAAKDDILKERINMLAGKKSYQDNSFSIKSIIVMISLTLMILSFIVIPFSNNAFAAKETSKLPACCVKHNHVSCSTSNCGFFSK